MRRRCQAQRQAFCDRQPRRLSIGQGQRQNGIALHRPVRNTKGRSFNGIALFSGRCFLRQGLEQLIALRGSDARRGSRGAGHGQFAADTQRLGNINQVASTLVQFGAMQPLQRRQFRRGKITGLQPQPGHIHQDRRPQPRIADARSPQGGPRSAVGRKRQGPRQGGDNRIAL